MATIKNRSTKLRPIEGVITLTGIVEKEGDQYVSYCRELGTASCGTTIEEAVANLEDAIRAHLNGLEETGEIFRVLREKHIRIDATAEPDDVPVEVRFAPDKLYTLYQHAISVPASV